MKYIVVFFLLLAAGSVFAQPVQPARLLVENEADSTFILWKAAAVHDSVAVTTAKAMLRFQIFNPSATDTLKFALCLTWADTANFIRIPPGTNGTYFNYEASDATWVRFVAFAASDTILARKIRFF